ncbi:MAG: hypothetical protein R2796_08145 [Chitinophagaceae bacterium]
MKKITYILSGIMALLSALPIHAQRTLSEGTITYDIVINTGKAKPQAADLLDGATSVVYLKGKSSRSEMISPLGQQATIVDGKTGNVTVLKEYGKQKYMITMTPDNWITSNEKYKGIKFNFSDVSKVILGYTCQKAVGTLADGSTFTVYFTRELLPVNKDFQYLNKDLPGLAMQYEANIGNLKATYTVSNINFDPVAQAKFELPTSGYRVLTYEESLGDGTKDN